MWNTSLVPIQWAKPHDAAKMPQLLCVKLEDPKNFTSQALRRSRAVIHLGVATVTSQGAEGILVEGRQSLSVVFCGLEKPLKLSFVAGNSICEALSHGDAPLGRIVGHVEITHEVSGGSVSVIILPCTDGLFQ